MPKRLNVNQKKFCKIYASDREFFGNGVQAYSEAYNVGLSTKSKYKTAQVNASKLLSNAIILEEINKLLDETINKQFVDKQLAFLITQNVDFHVKLGAIKEYNALAQRITKKVSGTFTFIRKNYGGSSRKKKNSTSS